MPVGRKTGGRQKGTPNKRTVATQEALTETRERIAGLLGDYAFAGDAHALLIAVYSNGEMAIDTRLDAAKAAIPYEKPRLASVDFGNKGDRPLVVEIMQFGSGPDQAPQ